MSSGAIIAAILGAHFVATPLANEIVPPLLNFGLKIFKEKVLDQPAAPRLSAPAGLRQDSVCHARDKPVRAVNSLANHVSGQPRRMRPPERDDHRGAE